MNRLIPLAAVTAFVALAACSDPNAIAPANLTNEVDTVTLWSLSHGAITQPSAYSIGARSGVRTWEAGINFEFIFDVDSLGHPVFIPIQVLDLLPSTAFKPGLKRPDASSFALMTKAPLNNYITETTIPVVAGDLFFVRTTVNACSILQVPLYAKMRVIDLDTAAQSVRLEVLADQNCGYRGLQPGIPKS